MKRKYKWNAEMQAALDRFGEVYETMLASFGLVPDDTTASRKGGRPQAADWAAFEEAFKNKVAKEGMPGPDNVAGWQSQADVERWLQNCLQRDRAEASYSTVRTHARRFLANISEGRN